ncbi:uncharacterized protein LOC120180759 [Hibiscus syriacus]|uniref:uncharacterized protein LOC120180759 n=1 Tax=Hibiscus syriacus TaxID=106335 RepID=UPI0019226B31|nr:uncharacterized protein LOC120180759 [Hibiscus syriacus]
MELDLCEGIRVGSGSIVLSHIQFADDLLIFSEGDERQLKNFYRVLKIFEVAAGLKLNLNKTKIFWINVEEERVRRWADAISCGWAGLPSTYLGLPLGFKRNSKSFWKPIVDKVNSHLDTWKGKLLSFGLTFFGILSQLEVFIGLSEKNICRPKSHGELGIFDVKSRNCALLNKWIWHFSEDNNSLWKKFVVAKYNYDQDSLIPKAVNERNAS